MFFKKLLFFSCVLGDRKNKKNEKRSGKTTRKKTGRREKDFCISIETLVQRLNLSQLPTLEKVKICLDGFNPVGFCAF